MFVRRKSFGEALSVVKHQVVESVAEAFETVKEFCEKRLGGKFVPSSEKGEKRYFAMCYVDRKLTREEITDIIVELRRGGRLKAALEQLLDKLGDFEIVEETREYPRSRIYYENFSEMVHVSSEDLMTFDIPSRHIEYVYPDSVEDSEEGRDAWFTIRAKGTVYYVKPGRPSAFSWGSLYFSPDAPLTKEDIRKHVDEFFDALRDILMNPRNFFKFKTV